MPNNQHKYYTMHFNIRSLPSKFSERKQIINRLDDMNVRLHGIMLCGTFRTDKNYVHYNIHCWPKSCVTAAF